MMGGGGGEGGTWGLNMHICKCHLKSFCCMICLQFWPVKDAKCPASIRSGVRPHRGKCGQLPAQCKSLHLFLSDLYFIQVVALWLVPVAHALHVILPTAPLHHQASSDKHKVW